MTFQTLKAKLSNILKDIFIVCLAVAFVFWMDKVYQQELQIKLQQREEHPMCKDKPNKTAWVAYRNGEARCFLESDNYPHRAMGSNIDD